MKKLVLIIVILAAATAASQVKHEILKEFDLPPHKGKVEAPRPRFGMYTKGVILHQPNFKRFPDITSGCEIWHLMPHWSADEAGLNIGDTVVALDGAELKDSIASGDNYMELYLAKKKAGETVVLTVLDEGKLKDVDVKLIPVETYEAVYVDPGIGEVFENSRLYRMIESKNIRPWTDRIISQMATTANSNYSKVVFGDEINPWRLNAVTYLHRYPARVGAYSRIISDDVWRGKTKNKTLEEALNAASKHMGVKIENISFPRSPETLDELKEYLEFVAQLTRVAYQTIEKDLDETVDFALGLLDLENSWESAIAAENDPYLKRKVRTEIENEIAYNFNKANEADITTMVNAAKALIKLSEKEKIEMIIDKLAIRIIEDKPEKVEGFSGDFIIYWESGGERFIIGGYGANRYSGDFALIIDPNGDDFYNLPPAKKSSYRAIYDLKGDDVYSSETYGVASGAGCVDALFDFEGNDVYKGEYCSMGAGAIGIGILADFGGDDYYSGSWMCQGAAAIGIGLLYDKSGMDSYDADVFSQGFGYVRGFGAILEQSGNDSYKAGWKHSDSRYPGRAHLAMSQGFGYGMRPWLTGVSADGGIGLLDDADGHDVYNSDYFSQGGSYWYALGILRDRKGCDRYIAGQYSQGSGIHLSHGALLDDEGDDMYEAYAGLEQGASHDWSSGCLEDLSGDDVYRGYTSSQGSALTVGFAYLYDKSGDDMYIINPSDTALSQGGGRYQLTREAGSLGILFDLGGGKDYYVDPRAKPGEAILKGRKGLLFDDGE